MKKIEIQGTKRDIQGTKGAASVRRNKRVPCVLYGGSGNVHFSVDAAALGKVVFTPETYRIEIDIDGDKRLALLHEKQFHPVTDSILHVDFMEMAENKEVKVSLAVKLKGQSRGVKDGGVLGQPLRKLRVKGRPASLPEHLDVDISNLGINESIHVSDLSFPGITIAEKPSDVVASVKMAKKEEVAATPAGGAAPAAGATAPAAAAGDAKKAEAAKPAAKPAAKK